MLLHQLMLCCIAIAGAVEQGQVVFQPTLTESSVPAQFRLPPSPFAYELERVLSTPGYSVSLLRFPSPIVSPDASNNVVHAEFFQPTGSSGRRPAVVVLHILGADFPLSRYMASRLADRGVAALFMKLPYYGERRPSGGSGPVPRRFLSADIERTVTSMRQGICDVRRAVCWLANRPDVDPSRLGVAGISLGGIVAAVAAAVDPSVCEGVFLVAGGDLSRILWGLAETRGFRESWKAAGRTIADLKALTDPFDPLTHAHRLAGKRILMLAGKVDEVIPPESTRALWSAAGRPPIEWFDCGHYSAIGYLLPAIRRTVEFLADPSPAASSKR